MDPGTVLLVVLAVSLVVLGLAGAVLPVLPGPPMVFLGLWLGAWIGGYERVGGVLVLGLAGVMIAAVLLDFVAGALGARRAGASPLAVAGATVGAVVGIFFGLPGVIFGPFVGAVAGELVARRELTGVADVGVATWVGLVLGAVAKVGLSLFMIGLFGLAWLF